VAKPVKPVAAAAATTTATVTVTASAKPTVVVSAPVKPMKPVHAEPAPAMAIDADDSDDESFEDLHSEEEEEESDGSTGSNSYASETEAAAEEEAARVSSDEEVVPMRLTGHKQRRDEHPVNTAVKRHAHASVGAVTNGSRSSTNDLEAALGQLKEVMRVLGIPSMTVSSQ
jgi:hypothetical protein